MEIQSIFSLILIPLHLISEWNNHILEIMKSTYREPGLGHGMDPDQVSPLSPNEGWTTINLMHWTKLYKISLIPRILCLEQYASLIPRLLKPGNETVTTLATQ